MDYNTAQAVAQKRAADFGMHSSSGLAADNYAQADVPQPQTQIGRIIEKLESMCASTQDTLNHQEHFLARLHGEQLTGENKANGISPCRSGSLGKIEDLLDVLSDKNRRIFQNQIILNELA